MADDGAVHIHPVDGVSAGARAEPPNLDVVFIHGLMGHWKKTWVPANGDRSWPEMLAKELPSAQVWSVEYPATALHWRAFVAELQPGTEQLADRILRGLSDMGIANTGGRPCVWVCHSLGGILAKRMLLKASASHDDPSAIIDHRQISGLMFLGTPHRGSDVANWAKGLVWFKSLAVGGVGALAELFGAMSGLGAAAALTIDHGFVGGSELLDELARHSDSLAILNQRFNTYLGARWDDPSSALGVRICAETLPLPLTNKLVVDLGSANPDFHAKATGPALPVYALQVSHETICKPPDENAEVHAYLMGLTRDVLKQEPFADLHADTPAHYRVRASVFRQLGRSAALREQLVRSCDVYGRTDEAVRIELTRRLTGDCKFAGLLDGINTLTHCLEQARDRMIELADGVNDADILLGWLLTAMAAQAHTPRNALCGTARHADDCDILDSALLEGAVAVHHGWPANVSQTSAAPALAGRSHVVTAPSHAGFDFRPKQIVAELERQLHSDVQGPETDPLRLALHGRASLVPLAGRERGKFAGMLRRLLKSRIGVVIDDRRSGALASHDDMLSAFNESALAVNLCVLGPTAEAFSLSDEEEGQFIDALEAYDRARGAFHGRRPAAAANPPSP